MALTACAYAQLNTSDTYSGPEVISRGGTNTTGQRAGRLVDFQFWGDLTGIYDSGLNGISVGPNGQVQSVGEEGIEAGGGVVGSRTWSRDFLSLDYTGHIRHYTPNSYFDGSDQLLQLDWRHTISHHVNFELNTIAGETSLSYGQLAFVPIRNADLIGVPQNQLFDNQNYFAETSGEVYWQKTARLSFGVGGVGFLTDYRSSALASMRGAQGRGDAVYRLTRRQKVYLTWQIMQFDYQRAFGYSTMNTAAAGWSMDLGRNWTFETQGGAMYVHTLGLIQRPVDPAIAVIIGRNYTITTSDRTVWVPEGVVRITRRFRRSAVDLGGAMTVSPGNGVYLTSRENNAYLNYSLVGSRRLSLSTMAAYSSLSSVGQQTIGKFESESGGLGATYRIHGNLHGELRYDFYHYTTQGAAYRKNENRVSLGVAYTSGERPLAIW
ncbi:MAG TPA: hypothetical protein VFA04_22200 [Bryobacteraceae bacterium]|nr:hypothetical protein [Bryobacteraceae bacterium]